MSSRVARKPIPLPAGVEVQVANRIVTVKGSKGQLTFPLALSVDVKCEDRQVKVFAQEGFEKADAIAGTTRAIINNHITGVSQGFTKKLQLVGVGYRAQAGKAKDGRATLSLTLGLSHPVIFIVPKEITLVVPSVTEIEVSGVDRQQVGQVAANIRNICKGIRRPEPYKGKGIRYADEIIILKETKKK